MKRLFNYRPIFYSFVALALGIFFARDFFHGKVFILIGLVCSFLAIFFLCLYTKCLKRFFASLIAFVIGIGVFVLSNYSFNNLPYENGIYTVSGRINTVSVYQDSQSVVLDNVYIDGDKIDKSITVFVGGASTLETGYVITFTDYLQKTKLFTLGEFNNYNYKYKIAYSASVAENKITIDKFDGLTISESLRTSIKNILYSNLGNDEASVCYASLFGDKSLIEGNIKNDFAESGLAHLLAVSGLHVGFIASILMFLLRKLPHKFITRPLVVGPILLFYCYLCSFSASVVRATIMFLTLAFADMFYKKYDRLNGLGLAGFAVLLYKPLSVYDPGFLLSFFCVFSITMFMPHFSRLFGKIKKLPKWTKESLALILSVQVGMLPLTIYYYGKTTILAILANFICVPVFEAFFTLLLVFLPFVAVLPFLGFLLIAPGMVISGIMIIAKWTASQTWAVVYLAWIPVILIVAVYVVMFIMSHFTNIKKKQKIGYSALILAFIALLAVGNSLSVKQQLSVTVINTYNNCSYVLEFDGVKYLVSNFDYFQSRDANVYFTSVVNDYAECLLYFNAEQDYSNDYCKNIYSSGLNQEQNILEFNIEHQFKNVKITPYSVDSSLCGYLFNYNGYKIFVCHDNADSYHVSSVIHDVGGVDILICSSKVMTDDVIFDAKYILVDGISIKGVNNINQTMQGNWTINIQNDRFNMRGID